MKKLLFFILSTVFVLIIPNLRVNAASDLSITAGGVDITNGNSVYTRTGSSSYTFEVSAASYTIYDFYVLYVATATTDTLNASLSGGCNVSCFGTGVTVKATGLSNGTYPTYIVILRRGKFDCGVGSGACIVNNNLTLYSDHNFYLEVFGAVGTNENPALNNNYQDFQSLMKNQNQNTQNIISNNNTNTNSIINNQDKNANQAHQDSQDIKNAVTSDEIPDNNNSQASEWASASASDSVVSDMVLMPITLLNAFSSGFNAACQAYNLGSLYGTNLSLPCINISNYLGGTLWGIIDVLMSGFLIYGIGKKFVKVFNDFTNLKDSQVDELYGGGNE